MDLRLLKQLRIIAVFFIFLLVIFIAIYFVSRPQLSCFDNIENQGEEGVDCGGPCELPCVLDIPDSPIVNWSNFFRKTDDLYELVAKVRNVNNNYGSSAVKYKFIAKDRENNVIAEIPGMTFLSPGQTRYILKSGATLPSGTDSVGFVVDEEIDWRKTPNRLEGDDFKVFDKKLTILKDEQFYAKVSGIVINQTSYDFKEVEVDAVLFNKESDAVTAGKTSLKDLKSGQEREFNIYWREKINSDLNIDVIPQTNFFENSNYVQNLN